MEKSIEFYNGNTNLKKAGVRTEYTKELVEEYCRCGKDVIYFVENYVKIVNLDKGFINFSLYDFQKTMLKTFKDNNEVICALGRQSGKSVTTAAFLLWQLIFNEEYKIAILANKAATSREILSRIQRMFEALPWWLKPGVKEWNKSSFELSTGSKIVAAATSSSSIRGLSCNCLMLDEFAFVDNDVEFYTSTFPVLSSGQNTKIIITSTPNGMNLFYKIFNEAKNGKNTFIPLEYTWRDVPGRDEKWRQKTLSNMTGIKQFEQEYENRFLGSSDTLINGPTLDTLTSINPIDFDDVYEDARIFEHPKEGHIYVAGVDTSEGVGKDSSVITIIDITETPYKQVMTYSNNEIDPFHFSYIVHHFYKKYNEAFLLVENNSYGKIVADMLHYDLEVENMIHAVAVGGITELSSSTTKVGIFQTKKTKSIGCSTLKSLIESGTLILQDETTINEIKTFVKKGSGYQAEKTKHDDHVMVLVLFAWFTSQNYFEDVTNVNIRKHLKENYYGIPDLPVGIFNDGIETQNIITLKPNSNGFLFHD